MSGTCAPSTHASDDDDDFELVSQLPGACARLDDLADDYDDSDLSDGGIGTGTYAENPARTKVLWNTSSIFKQGVSSDTSNYTFPFLSMS